MLLSSFTRIDVAWWSDALAAFYLSYYDLFVKRFNCSLFLCIKDSLPST